jgi:hypothetical protein
MSSAVMVATVTIAALIAVSMLFLRICVLMHYPLRAFREPKSDEQTTVTMSTPRHRIAPNKIHSSGRGGTVGGGGSEWGWSVVVGGGRSGVVAGGCVSGWSRGVSVVPFWGAGCVLRGVRVWGGVVVPEGGVGTVSGGAFNGRSVVGVVRGALSMWRVSGIGTIGLRCPAVPSTRVLYIGWNAAALLQSDRHSR